MLKLLEPVVERLKPAAGGPDSDEAPPAGSVEHRLLETAEDVFDDGDLTLDSTKDDVVGWDSLGNMNLVVALEDEFGVEFDETDLHDADALCDLHESILAKRE